MVPKSLDFSYAMIIGSLKILLLYKILKQCLVAFNKKKML